MFVSMLGFGPVVDHLSSTLLFLVPHAKGLMMMVMMTSSGCSLLTSGGSNSHHQVCPPILTILHCTLGSNMAEECS